MRICQVLASRGGGGLERHFVDLCNRLSRRHEVIAVAHPDFAPKLDPEVRLHPLGLEGWRYNPASLLRLYRVLAGCRPDIIHAQANKAAAMVGCLRPGLKAKCVATVHNLKHNTRMFRAFDRVIAVSREAAAQLDHPGVEVIYNGIDPPPLPPEAGSSYIPAALGKALAPPVAIAVGRLVPAKGFALLLRAWKDVRASLVIVGDGPERARLEALVGEYGLDGRVVLAGFRRDVPALMAGADLMVIASRNEGFPYVLVEGLHLRRVVVSTRVPGALDVLPEGYMVKYGEPAQLAAAVKRVLSDVEAARRAFIPVWDMAARDLTLERMVERTEQVYQGLMDAAPA